MNPTKPLPETFARLLPRLEQDASQFYGSPVQLTPGRLEARQFSHLLRLAVYRDKEATPSSHLFLKVSKAPGGCDLEAMRQRVARDFDVTSRVYKAMSGYDHLGAVPTVACYPEQLAIATEEVNGPTLLNHLTTRASWLPSARRLHDLEGTMVTTGRWIRVFQSLTTPGGSISIDDLKLYIDHRLKRLVSHAGSELKDEGRDRVLACIDRLGERISLGDLRAVQVHGDMSLSNVLVDGQRIVALDFSMAALGNPLLDLTSLFLQVELLAVKPYIRQSTVRRLQTALLSGYHAQLTADDPLFRLSLLLHRVNHYGGVTFGQASWPENLYNRLVRRHHWRRICCETHRRDSGRGGGFSGSEGDLPKASQGLRAGGSDRS